MQDFIYDLEEASEFAERTLSLKWFQIIGVSCAKLSPKCFRYLTTEAKWGTSRKMPSDSLQPVLYVLCLGIRKGSKYLGLPLCWNLYTSTAVLNIKQYLIGNQCSAFLTGVMCKYLELWPQFWQDCFEHIEV